MTNNYIKYLFKTRDFLHKRICLSCSGHSSNQHPTLTSYNLGCHNYCVKAQVWMHRTFRDVGRYNISLQIRPVCLLSCTSLWHMTCDAITVSHSTHYPNLSFWNAFHVFPSFESYSWHFLMCQTYLGTSMNNQQYKLLSKTWQGDVVLELVQCQYDRGQIQKSTLYRYIYIYIFSLYSTGFSW